MSSHRYGGGPPMIRVRWTGAAGLEFIYNGSTLLIDPYFSRAGLGQVLFGRLQPNKGLIEQHLASMKPVRAMVVSHTHFDHALDVPVVAGHVDGPVLGSESLYRLMRAYGLGNRVRVCSPGEKMVLDDQVAVTMLPSKHGRVLVGRVPYPGEIEENLCLPLKAAGYKVGQVYAPRIHIKNRVFLHVGSAGYDEESLDGQSCDVLFLCVPGWKRMAGYPDRIIRKTTPHTVILFHHDDFFKPLDKNRKVRSLRGIGLSQLRNHIQKNFPHVRLMCPALFETMVFD